MRQVAKAIAAKIPGMEIHDHESATTVYLRAPDELTLKQAVVELRKQLKAAEREWEKGNKPLGDIDCEFEFKSRLKTGGKTADNPKAADASQTGIAWAELVEAPDLETQIKRLMDIHFAKGKTVTERDQTAFMKAVQDLLRDRPR